MNNLENQITTRINDKLLEKVEERVKEKSYSSKAEYLRDLIRKDVLNNKK